MLPLTWFSLLCAGAAAASRRIPSQFKPGGLSEKLTTKDNREYRVFLPASYDGSTEAPLILSYHGSGGTIKKQKDLDGLTESWRNDKYIVAYLQGLVPPKGSHSRWQISPDAQADDQSFTKEVLDTLERQLAIDRRRVYATGKSQGGGFVGALLACNETLGRRFAAFAPVSGAYYLRNETSCDPEHIPIACATTRTDTPILAFHGGADDTIAYGGGPRQGACLPAVRHWIRSWVVRNGLRGTERNTSLPDSAAVKNGVRSAWRDDRVVLVYDGDQAPHDWPSTVANRDNGGKNLTSFNATDMILHWFDGWTLPV